MVGARRDEALAALRDYQNALRRVRALALLGSVGRRRRERAWARVDACTVAYAIASERWNEWTMVDRRQTTARQLRAMRAEHAARRGSLLDDGALGSSTRWS